MSFRATNLATPLVFSVAAAAFGCSQAETSEPDGAVSADALPNFDILLGTMAQIDGKLQVNALKLVADYEGYDNQPHFTTDGRAPLLNGTRREARPFFLTFNSTDVVLRLSF